MLPHATGTRTVDSEPVWTAGFGSEGLRVVGPGFAPGKEGEGGVSLQHTAAVFLGGGKGVLKDGDVPSTQSRARDPSLTRT